MKYNYHHPQRKRGSWKQLELHPVLFTLFESFFNPFSIPFQSVSLSHSFNPAFFGFWFLPIAVCISFGENLYFCFAFASIFHSLTLQLVIVGEYFLNLWPYMQNSNCHSFHIIFIHMTINMDCCLFNNFGKKTNKDQLINWTKQRKIKANI